MADQKKVKINIQPDKMEAKYSDFAIVGKNPLGFHLDFGQRMPSGNQVNIVSRVAMSPQHAKLLLAVLKNNVEQYEREFGEISIPKRTVEGKGERVIHFVK